VEFLGRVGDVVVKLPDAQPNEGADDELYGGLQLRLVPSQPGELRAEVRSDQVGVDDQLPELASSGGRAVAARG
jgi:hypothetical protein